MEATTTAPSRRVVTDDHRIGPSPAANRLSRSRAYGEMAAAIGRPRAARAVGSALAANPLPLLIPCHRVVGAGRRLGFYSDGGPDMKRRLLAYEGADVASFR